MDQKIFLLVDDDIDDTELFCEALNGINDQVICHYAGNGGEALTKLDGLAEKPHLIFLDVNTPVMNGWQCLKRLKADERYRQIPVIIMSTSSHKREMDIAAELGALCYFTKPNNFNVLRQVMQVIVANVGKGLESALENFSAPGFQFLAGYTNANKAK